VLAQRDHVVALYALLAAAGRLSIHNLGLSADEYDPKVHFDQVKDLWLGSQSPSGR
jgi:outer membrane protein